VGIKTWQLAEALATVRPLIGPETVAISLLNGVEAIAWSSIWILRVIAESRQLLEQVTQEIDDLARARDIDCRMILLPTPWPF